MHLSVAVRLSSNNGLYGHSVDTVASHFEEEEPFESLEEIEAQTIGNLLPDDDDLLSGVIEGIDGVAQSNGDDMEELDFFSSVGGMDLGDDGFTAGRGSGFSAGNSQSLNAVAGEHPYGEHPSRTLFVRNINSSVEDSELKALFEVCSPFDYHYNLHLKCDFLFSVFPICMLVEPLFRSYVY